VVACWMSLAAVGEVGGPQHNRIIALQQPGLAPEPTPGPKLRDIELKLRNIKRQGLFGDVCGYDGNGPLFYRKYRCRITEPFVEIIGPLYA